MYIRDVIHNRHHLIDFLIDHAVQRRYLGCPPDPDYYPPRSKPGRPDIAKPGGVILALPDHLRVMLRTVTVEDFLHRVDVATKFTPPYKAWNQV